MKLKTKKNRHQLNIGLSSQTKRLREVWKRIIACKVGMQTEIHERLDWIIIEWGKLKERLRARIGIIKSKVIWTRQFMEHWLAMNYFLAPRFLSFKLNTFLSRGGLVVFTIAYFTSVYICLLVLSRYVSLAIEIGIARDFFIGAAAMVGGTLAIVASFAQYTIQHAAEQLPKDFYKLATSLKRYLIIFMADVIITLSLFCAAFSYGRLNMGLSALSIQIGVLLVAASFYLILLLLRQVRIDVDRDKILVKAVKSLIHTVKEAHTRTVKFAQAQLLHPSNRGKFTLEEVLANLYQSPMLSQQLEYLKRELDYLFDYHDSFVATNQKRAALEVLQGIGLVVSTYLDARKSSSSAFPEANSLMALTSDSQYVLQPILERAISLSENYMKSGDTAGIIASVNVFIEWSTQASQIQYTGIRNPENPILEQVAGYFNMLMDRAIKISSLEGMYQGLRFYKATSVICVEKSYIHILSAMIGKVEALGDQGFLSKQDPVIGEAYSVYAEVLNTVFNSQPFLFEHYFMVLEQHLNNLVLFGYAYTTGGGVRNNLTAQQDVAKPHKKLREMIYRAVAKVKETNDAEEKRHWRRAMLSFTKNLRKSLRTLSTDMKNPNHMLILSFGQIIDNVGVLLVKLTADEEWISDRSELIVEAKWYLHLSTWFLHDINNFETNLSFDSLIEAITHIGMASLEYDDLDDIAGDAIKVLASKAMEFLDKQKTSGGMYLEPEIMEHACYLGIIALKKGKTQLVEELKPKITAFDEKYLHKYFNDIPEGWDAYSISPPADKVKKDLQKLYQRRDYGWTDRFGMGMTEDTTDEMMSIVTAADIESFIVAIWGESSP